MTVWRRTVAVVVGLLVHMAVVTPTLADASGWVLPFPGTKYITSGPGEDLHVNASAEAIDYVEPGNVQFEVLAPADGTVLDVCYVGDFGWVVRTSHAFGLYSFFAHLDPVSVDQTQSWSVKPGQSVRQGQWIANTENSGSGGAGFHLHYEARTIVTSGCGNNVYSGQAAAIRAVPGNWWNTWYSPAPDFRGDPNKPSGGAQFPENATQPSTMLSTGRHLANEESPPAAPASHGSNWLASQGTIHMGGSPTTPGSSNYDAWFQVWEYQFACPCWERVATSQRPAVTLTHVPSWMETTNACLHYNSQSCRAVYAWNPLRGWGTYGMIEGVAGDASVYKASLVASYKPKDLATRLEYGMAGADWYNGWEWHGPGTERLIYAGQASTIRVTRSNTQPNWYIAIAHFPTAGWGQWSEWLRVSYK